MTRSYTKPPRRREYHGHAVKGRVSGTYVVWQNMKKRCLDPSSPQYKDYGGRGITVCAEWVNSFAGFLADMGEAPKGRTLDRRNNDEGYSKTNCRWATRAEQSRNTRRNAFYTFRGETRCLSDWAVRFQLDIVTLFQRLKIGWDIEQALTTPAVKGRNQFGSERELTFAGKTRTVREWARELGVRPGTLHQRLWRGWSMERALQS